MKRAIQATILTAVMAATAFGGDMQNGYTQPDPPQPSSQSAYVDGGAEFEADGGTQDGLAETVVEVSLGLLQTLLALT